MLLFYNWYLSDISDYIDILMEMAFRFEKDEKEHTIPPPMSQLYERPTLEEVEAMKEKHRSRFSADV